VSGPRTASGLPEPVEDAVQFFLYRVQVGAAVQQDRWSPAEIRGLLDAPPDGPDPLAERVQAALAAALRRDRAQARAAARLASAIGQADEPPLTLWTRHRTALLAHAPPSRLRAAVAVFELEMGFLRRIWRRWRGR